jgi:hypothetical protein
LDPSSPVPLAPLLPSLPSVGWEQPAKTNPNDSKSAAIPTKMLFLFIMNSFCGFHRILRQPAGKFFLFLP